MRFARAAEDTTSTQPATCGRLGRPKGTVLPKIATPPATCWCMSPARPTDQVSGAGCTGCSPTPARPAPSIRPRHLVCLGTARIVHPSHAALPHGAPKRPAHGQPLARFRCLRRDVSHCVPVSCRDRVARSVRLGRWRPLCAVTQGCQAAGVRARGACTRPVGCGRRRCGARSSQGRRLDSRRRCALRRWRQ
jgi:hypothetical protein